jgi:hypothetical protein
MSAAVHTTTTRACQWPAGGAVQLVQALRRMRWPGVVSALAVVALLVVFQHVVRGAVQQGELRRQAVAEQAEAMWRCKDLRSHRMRADCLSQLQASANPGTTVRVVRIGR